MVSLGERLKAAMDARTPKVTVAALSREVGMSYQGVRKIVDGKTQEMDASNCIKIAAFLKVNSEWLRTGKGPRGAAELPPPVRAVSESQWALLEDFELLPIEEKQAILGRLRANADNVRRVLAEYFDRQGAAQGTGASPPSSSPVASYQKITPIPAKTHPVKKRGT